jgi:3'(2'), 5'-bisphosphate nucleotidase
MQTRTDLEALVRLALAAGREVMAVRDAGFTAEKKSDGSLVTIADQRAEAVIEAGLAELAPGIPMLGEESSAAGRIPNLGERFFCVDPIDGTRDFVAGETGEFTVNIALVEHGVPVMGVVLAPATGALYAGEPGRAVKAFADARSANLVSDYTSLETARANAWRVIASRHSGKNTRTELFLEALGACERLNSSSSIKFCRLAEGDADLYPRFGQVSEWDTAAGHAVLAAADGGVMRLDGAPLMYGNAEEKFLIPGFVAYACAAAREAALAALTRMPKA